MSVPWRFATTVGGPWYVPRFRDITIRSTSYCATVVRADGARI